jgi:uncharacterized membrane protein YvbJ
VYCPSCGAQNPDGAAFCSGCGKKLQQPGGGPQGGSVQQAQPVAGPAPNMLYYMIGAIATTFLCCPPVGIAAIVFALQINTKVAVGDLEGAQKSAKIAMILCAVAAGLGVIGWLIFLMLGGIASLASMTPTGYGM